MKNAARRIFEWSGFVASLMALATAVTALAISFRIRIANEWQQKASLPIAAQPSSRDSILVFAPHSDDETLGCGGMLATAAKNGAKVHVALITNGDGFRIAVSRAYRTIRVTPSKCVEFAYLRQQETLHALAVLGVPRKCVTFLGYPDRGIAKLWTSNWGYEPLYISHSTASDHSPYRNSLTLNAPYCGESLISDIEQVIRTVKPTDIYLPHPSDNHPDHYATYCFVTAALEQLQSEGFTFAHKIRAHTYLVHRGDWPCPESGGPLSPPYALAQGDTQWHTMPLTDAVAEKKRNAILQYKTQTGVAVEKEFMLKFARTNELFGDLPDRQIVRVPRGSMIIDGKPDDWANIPPVISDPVGDYVVADFSRGGDVRSVYMCTDGRYLYVRLDCVSRISKRINYTFNFRTISDGKVDNLHSVTVRPPSWCSQPSDIWARNGDTLELAVPMKELDFSKDIFVQINTKTLKLTVDNTGWHGLEMAQAAH